MSSNIHEDIKASYALPDSPTVAAMKRLREAAQRMSDGLEAGQLDVFAESMNASCDALYALHPSCDSAAHRELCTALDGLILARKTCGAGGGGFIFFQAKPGRRPECVRIAEQLGDLVWPLRIDFEGVVSWDSPASSDEEVARYRQLASQ